MSRPAKAKSDYFIQTVSNALRLLEAFDDAPELGVSELGRMLDLHKNNVFRLLATLEGHGYIERSPSSDRYRLGTACLERGRAYLRGQELAPLARQVLKELSGSVGETTHFAVLRGFEVVHLYGHSAAGKMLRSSLRIGHRLPAHCTALGKVLLGCASETVRRDYATHLQDRVELGALSSQTITDRDKLFAHLQSVGMRGYALDQDECEAGLSCAAAPVYRADGHLIGALSVSGPSSRLSEERLRGEILRQAIAAADRLSRALGYAG